MSKKLYFISKDASWQKYRFEVLSMLADTYNYEIEILTTGDLQPYLKNTQNLKYKLFASWLPNILKISFYPKVLWYIYKNKPDYILSMSNASNLTEFVAFVESRFLKVPFVFWTHGYDHHHRKANVINSLREWYILFFLKKADHIITFSPKGKFFLINQGIATNHITVAPNTLNTDQWLHKSKELEKTKLRESHGYSMNDTILLFSGRLYKDKKLINVLKAMKHIQKQHNDFSIYLHVIGDGTEYLNLENYVKINEIHNVVFHGALYEESAVSEIFSISDIFVMPSSVGLAIIHAFCFSLPIITEESCSHGPEIQYLKENVNGYILKEDSIDQWVTTILKLHKNKILLKSMSNASLNIVQNEGSIQNMIKEMNQAFLALSNKNTLYKKAT